LGRDSRLADDAAFATWTAGARAFGTALWEVLGERRNPRIVFEHPGEDTIPTSIFVCDNGGMVVICAGTTGYHAAVDLRYLWMRQKRLQGSHFANDAECAAYNQMVARGEVDPCCHRRSRSPRLVSRISSCGRTGIRWATCRSWSARATRKQRD